MAQCIPNLDIHYPLYQKMIVEIYRPIPLSLMSILVDLYSIN